MKKNVGFIIVLATIMSMLAACDFVKDIFPASKSKLTFKASLSSKTNLSDTVLFTGNDIKWINGTTGEVLFADSMTISKVVKFHWIKCYLGNDSLFTATITVPTMSAVINDLVLDLDINDGHFYFEDGYPSYIDNLGTHSIRIQNKEKRAIAWSRFINELKEEGRYVEK